jgi:lipopolysaccharide/colanic/teichoic acid biosynthesis glycosyltransferase
VKLWQVAQRGLAAVALLLILPILVVLAVAIRLESPGPALHRATRIGRAGHPIVIHKLRTMAVGAESSGPPITSRQDLRITRIGRLLRDARIDELPQLWDVVRGRLSLVGPRPEAPVFVDLADPRWIEVLSVRPGITGATQLRFRNESQRLDPRDPVLTYREVVLPEKLASDVQYVRTRTVANDLRILLRTIGLMA